MSGANVIIYILCISLSGAGAWLVGRYGCRFELLDEPNDRSSHSAVTPKGAGIGMLAGFIACVLLLRISALFWIPAAILALISFVGDRRNLTPILRLFFQLAASIICLWGIWNAHPWANIGSFMILPLALFVVGTTNYYNFMDGINGLAAITGIIGFGLLAIYSVRYGTIPAITPLAICMVSCCLGFLPFNIPHAKVFMGDVGSILLGFVFAIFVVWQSVSLASFLCLASFLFPFYADEITTEIARLKNGEKLWTPHRKHLYQLLANEYNIPHWKISIGYGIAQIFVGASVLIVLEMGGLAVFFILFFHFFLFSSISIALRKSLKHSKLQTKEGVKNLR